MIRDIAAGNSDFRHVSRSGNEEVLSQLVLLYRVYTHRLQSRGTMYALDIRKHLESAVGIRLAAGVPHNVNMFQVLQAGLLALSIVVLKHEFEKVFPRREPFSEVQGRKVLAERQKYRLSSFSEFLILFVLLDS